MKFLKKMFYNNLPRDKNLTKKAKELILADRAEVNKKSYLSESRGQGGTQERSDE